MDKELKILMNKYGKRAVNELKNKLVTDKTNASRDTLNSIQYKPSGGDIVISFDPSLNILDEGLNRGQRISRSGSEGIIKWMKSKNIRPKFAKGVPSERDYRASAFLIARKIKEKGTIRRFGYKGSNILSILSNNSSFGIDLNNDLGLYVTDKIQRMFNEMKK